MTRSIEEWIGKTDDAMPPPRVRVRIFDRFDGRCQCGCNRKIFSGEKWQCDHIIALINKGENREFNMHPLLTEHHKGKTADDMAEKSHVYKRRKSHIGIRKPSRFACSRNSKFKKKITGEVVLRGAE